MNNTALRAEKEITNTIIFRNEKHKDFYQTYMKKCRRQDVYHKALIYCLGKDCEIYSDFLWGKAGTI